MWRCGLTGGIGSGKSTVAAGLAARGAGVVDADRVARQVVEPGRPAFAALVERFGGGIVGPDGRLDRRQLAAMAFTESGALAALNRITHPAIAEEVEAQARALTGEHPIVVLDIPLLDRRGVERYELAAVVVVDTPEEAAIARLVGGRGFDEADARARVAAQVSRDERRALADLVIDNAGDRASLEAQIQRAWEWLEARAATAAG